MMSVHLKKGDKVSTTAGTVRITGAPLEGGEGIGYQASLDGSDVFLKLYTDTEQLPPGFLDHDSVRRHIHNRIRRLVGAQLYLVDPRFNAPFAMTTDEKRPGYVCQWVDNLMLWSEWRQQDHPYGERIGFIGQLASLLRTLHEHGIAHGDVNANNVCVMGSADSLRVMLIDFGNYNNGDPSLCPLMSNDSVHISPWLFANKGVTDVYSDLYALGVIAHEAFLVRTIDAGGRDEADMRLRRRNGTLPGDPLCGTRDGADGGGLPYESLSPQLQTKLRLLLAPDRGSQPSALDFIDTLNAELNNLIECSHCHSPYWWHTGLTLCPCCKAVSVPPALQVRLPDKDLPLRHTLVLGRDDLPGNPYLSDKHLAIQPAYPGAARVFVTGRNGMTLIAADGLRRQLMPESGAVLVRAGDRLQLLVTRIDFLP